MKNSETDDSSITTSDSKIKNAYINIQFGLGRVGGVLTAAGLWSLWVLDMHRCRISLGITFIDNFQHAFNNNSSQPCTCTCNPAPAFCGAAGNRSICNELSVWGGNWVISTTA